MSDWKMIFATNFANIGSLKSLPTLFDMCLDHMLLKFEQVRTVKNIQTLELFNRKQGLFIAIFDKAILKHFSVAVTIVEC